MKYYIKYFVKINDKFQALNISLKQCGAGHLMEVTNVKESDEPKVKSILNEALSSRDLCIGKLKYDSEYKKFTGNIRLLSRGGNDLSSLVTSTD
jgi:hypothetical protein|tara:strand:+ start:247 stop:528 length:282 start_codon:yes stop_codon:yes gene_type:complete